MLIPSREASAYCRHILKLPVLWAATWDLIGVENEDEKILYVQRVFTRAPDEKIRTSVEQFCSAMAERGYLIPVEEQA